MVTREATTDRLPETLLEPIELERPVMKSAVLVISGQTDEGTTERGAKRGRGLSKIVFTRYAGRTCRS